jgi:hypothetical protein
MKATEKLAPKRIVYLWGAGATQGEAQNLGATTSLIMRDTDDYGEGIATRILDRLGSRVRAAYGSAVGSDIEKLISLLSASGTDEHTELAEEMREAYFNVLRTSLANAGVLARPQLAIQLLEMHRKGRFKNEVESLEGFITTNHDGLLQVASQEVFGNVNLGFEYISKDFTLDHERSAPPILQLHGSFTWRFGTPLSVAKLRRNSSYGTNVWIPPTILKESKSYPFNKLSGLAYELLVKHCDVLRVVGASLTQNDWNILSLIFNAQRHLESNGRTAFAVELIMPHYNGEYIRKECAYLRKVSPIGYLTDGDFAEYKDFEDSNPPPDSRLANPFGYWLSEKQDFHAARGELTDEASLPNRRVLGASA